MWDALNGDKQKIQRSVAEELFTLYIQPAILKLPLAVQAKLMDYLKTTPKDTYGGCLGDLINYLPAIHNHLELMTAFALNLTRRNKINDFFDLEMMPVPLAYASVFVAQDRGIREPVAKPDGNPQTQRLLLLLRLDRA